MNIKMFYWMPDISKIFSRQTFVHNICLCIWWTQPICCPSARWSREPRERTLASHLQPLEKMRRQLSGQSTSIVHRQREFHINQAAALCDNQWREEERETGLECDDCSVLHTHVGSHLSGETNNHGTKHRRRVQWLAPVLNCSWSWFCLSVKIHLTFT